MVKGKVALIGSGELSATMVETHKSLLSRVASRGKALFLDTPAGFQENADLIARRAADYFERQVGQPMEIASFKSAKDMGLREKERVFRQLGEAGYVLIGPGSPTYTVRQLHNSPIPALLGGMVARGDCLVVASAAALTVGSHTLPVYEIYKVGQALHWIEGLNVLGHLGLELVVIPHWNNAEGGNHDTRYCYMGEKRFRALQEQLPPGTVILGIDEHTACILNFSSGEASVEGIGKVTIRYNEKEQQFGRREKFSFEQLKAGRFEAREERGSDLPDQEITETADNETNSFWERMHAIEESFHNSLAKMDMTAITTQLLEADRLLWQAQLDLENPEYVSQGRELYREMIVLAGTGLDRAARESPRKLEELVKKILALREIFRQERRWPEADQLRSLLNEAEITVEDTPEGPRWRL